MRQHDPDAEPDWMDFLTHGCYLVTTIDLRVEAPNLKFQISNKFKARKFKMLKTVWEFAVLVFGV
jgi:hypothetical protein